MALIDYGAILKVDGVFVNKDADLFMDTSDTGYVCKKASNQNGEEFDIDGNYYVYAGDKDFLLAFYKGSVVGISNEKIVFSRWNIPFCSETVKSPDSSFPEVKISHLDPAFYVCNWIEKEASQTWEDYVRETWIGATGKEALSELQNGTKRYRWFQRLKKRIARKSKQNDFPKYRTNRYVATWEHGGHSYECIFGYGIDPDKEVYLDMRDDFTETEKEVLDSWFEVAKEEIRNASEEEQDVLDEIHFK